MLILVESRRLVNTTLVFSPFSLLKLVPHPYFLNLRCSQTGMEQESLSVGRLRCKKAFDSSLKKIQETTIIPQSFGFLFCMQPQDPSDNPILPVYESFIRTSVSTINYTTVIKYVSNANRAHMWREITIKTQ